MGNSTGANIIVLMTFFLNLGVLKAVPPEVLIPAGPRPLTLEEQKRIERAIEGGIAYLRRTQLPTGSWTREGPGTPASGPGGIFYPTAFAALGGLALLECGAAAGDPAVQQAAAFVRANIPGSHRTYETSLSVIFLDRLGEIGDRPLIRSLALRLAGGQSQFGGWGYDCPVLTPAQEKRLMENLKEQDREDVVKRLLLAGAAKAPGEKADNSNTQFAILALWVARKYDLPLDYNLAFAEQRFRLSQRPDGWDYQLRVGPRYGSMTCVGLLALAAGRGSAPESPAADDGRDAARPRDGGIDGGLRALAVYMNDPSDVKAPTAAREPTRALNLYFLWSVERVGVLCNVRTIGGRDWYRWGASLLLPAQNRDGSWTGRGSGGCPAIDTSFALLFLKRSDLLPDLRETLQKRLTITDPGLDPKTAPGKSPGEKGKKKSPGDKGESSAEAEDAPLMVNLGDLKAKETSEKPLRVRGPGPFRILAVRGADAELKLKAPTKNAEVHELNLTLRPSKVGEFQRTIYLITDIPGRGTVRVEILAAVK